jgi:hypothetical protein
MIHIPSLFNVSMGTSCMGYPYMHLSYHTKQEMTISYAKWDDCERDFNRVKSALKEVDSALDGIVLTEETIVLSLPSPSSSSSSSSSKLPISAVSVSSDIVVVESATQ